MLLKDCIIKFNSHKALGLSFPSSSCTVNQNKHIEIILKLLNVQLSNKFTEPKSSLEPVTETAMF